MTGRGAAAGVLLAIVAGCGERPPRVEYDPGPTPPEHAAAEALFEANCADCHGQRAAGTEAGPPLVHIYYEPAHHADIAFRRAVELGVRAHHWNYGPMPPVPGLSPEQIAAITAYLRWLQRQAGIY